MPVSNNYWYVLFVCANKEINCANMINKALIDHVRAFVPLKTCVYRRHGQKSLFQKIGFPGYVFIESGKSPLELPTVILPYIYRNKHIYKFLHYDDNRQDIAMRNDERLGISKILGGDYNIGISKGFRDGNNIKIIAGALTGNEHIIVKVNKRQNMAVIRFHLFDALLETFVGLEVIESPEA